MSVRPHETIRVQVSIELGNVLREVVEERCEASKDPHLCTLLRLLGKPEVTVLMPQEIRVGEERRYVDMALGREIVFEFKSSEKELEEAARDAEAKYWGLVSKAKFFIATNWDRWRIYRVTKSGLELVRDCSRAEARALLRSQLLPQLERLKVPATPRNVEALYKLDHERALSLLRGVFERVRNDPRVKPLYEAYKGVMSMLYGEASDEFFANLFVRHTYMHMAVSASLAAALGEVGDLERACSGAFLGGANIALPYLNWWRVALGDPDLRGSLWEVLESVAGRASMVDWSLGAEDVFRALYEFLIEPETRRRIGEYYTPLWLVEMMVGHFDLRGRVVLDPFCGSGTFLVEVFHRKVDLGEEPEEALGEVVGFDINPLAVAVARSELVLAYYRRAGSAPKSAPHVYHIDTLSAWFRDSPRGLEALMDKAASYMGARLFGQLASKSPSEVLSALRALEEGLTFSIRFAYGGCGCDKECLKESITKRLRMELGASGGELVQSFLEHFERDSVAEMLADLIVEHGGDDVWAVVLASAYAAVLMSEFKPDIIVTNPPWVPVTEYKAPYAKRITKYMLRHIKAVVGARAASVLAGADIALAALGKSVELAREGVAFVMNREQLFCHRSPMQAGVVAAYSLLRSLLGGTGAEVLLYDIDFDAFGHGVYPAVVVVKKGGSA